MVIWNKGCTFLCNSNCSQAMENSKVFPIMQETPLDNQEGSTHQLPAGLEPATYALRMRRSTN